LAAKTQFGYSKFAARLNLELEPPLKAASHIRSAGEENSASQEAAGRVSERASKRASSLG